MCINVGIINDSPNHNINILYEQFKDIIKLYHYTTDIDINKNIIEDKLDVIITISEINYSQFTEIMKLSYFYRSKWIHIKNINDVNIDDILRCYLFQNKSKNIPLISIITSNYNVDTLSNLQEQTYSNWEWIITSNDDIIITDPRIKKYKYATGDIYIHLDSNNKLDKNYLKIIVDGFNTYSDINFIYTDYIIMNSNVEGIPQKFDSYYRNNSQIIKKSVDIHSNTIDAFLNEYNGVNAWRASFYNKLKYCNEYERMIQTFLKGKILRIPYPGYVKNSNIITSLSKFNEKIKFLYSKKITKHLDKFGANISDTDIIPYWKKDHLSIEKYCNIVYRKDLISIIIPTYKRKKELKRAIYSILDQTYQNFEICIVGDKCPDLDNTMLEYTDNRIKWWNLTNNSNDSGATPRNYALKMMASGKYIAYLDDDDYWTKDHLELCINIFKSNSNISYVFSSFQMGMYPIIAVEPKLYRISSSALIHKYDLLEKYGYWSCHLYTHDWDLVSRWVTNKEIYGITKKITMIYEVNPRHVNAKGIYEAYGDQLIYQQKSESESISFAITTLTYNNRESLFKVIKYIKPELINAKIEINWYILLQNCNNDFIDKVKLMCNGLNIKLLIYENNLGLSLANNILIEKTKNYKYILHLEDDWILLPKSLQPYKSTDTWLDICLSYMELHKDTSTIFLRAYNNEKEKWQYAWNRTIPYVCHKYPDNFNYENKMKNIKPEIYCDNKFTEIPTFLFTFNPCIRRNIDYHRTVFPLNEFNNDQKDKNKNQHWGWCEATAMEKIRHLRAVWFNEGIFGHHEDWILDLKE